MTTNIQNGILKKFFAQIKSISDAFPDIDLLQEPWGYYLKRTDKNSKSICFLLQDNSQNLKNLNESLEDKETIWFTTNESVKEKNIAKLDSLTIFHKLNSFSQTPFFESGFAVRKFSFNLRTKGTDTLYNALSFLPTFFGVSTMETKSFEKIPRGMLHVIKSSLLWILLDVNDTVIGIAISTEEDGLGIISYLSVNLNFRHKGYGNLLIQTILSHFQKSEDILLILQEKKTNLPKRLGFSPFLLLTGYLVG